MPKNKNQKPKILIIGTTDNKGGAASVGWSIGEEMRRRGYWVKYIVGYKFTKSEHVHELHKPKALSFLDKVLNINITALARHFRSFILANDIDFGASKEITNHPWYKEANIIHFHNLHGSYFKLSILAEIKEDKKTIWTLHDMWAMTGNCVYTNDKKVWEEGKRSKNKIMEYPPMLWDNSRYLWRKKKKIYSEVNMDLVSPSDWLKKRAKESILKNFKTTTIHNGVDTNTFRVKDKDKARERVGLPKNKKIVLFVAQGGSHDPRKGWEYAKQVIERYPNYLFVSVGGGSDKTESNIRHVKNITSPSVMTDYYGSSDLFLFTSLAENCPLVLIEALSSGVPVVSFDVGGAKEIIRHKENGYIAEYKDIEDIISGIKWVESLESKELTSMSKKGRKRAEEHFSIKNMADQYEKIYRK